MIGGIRKAQIQSMKLSQEQFFLGIISCKYPKVIFADGNNRAIQSPFSYSALPSRRKRHRLLGRGGGGKVAK